MDLGIANRIALVTGGGGGLGGAIADSLAREGARVVVADIDLDAARQAASRIEAAGGTAMPMHWDLSELGHTEARVARIAAHWGDVQILVNNTGGPPPTLAQGVHTDDWEKHFRAMVASVIRLTDAVLPGMRRAQWGRVITSASSGVAAPIPNLGISNTLRAALLGWSKTLSREVAAAGITANVVLPGRIATRRIQQLDEAKAGREGRALAEVVDASTDSIPAGRYGRPQEYGDTVAFLASEAASYITGSTVRVDGGLIPGI
ncbi:SDR family oxidoreductase [Bordetella bronchiseptica]|uniref:SDR family oxidoreductase n=1 Tax=Bordetella bronchiseptica TaxID=518 RepID=UPI00028FC28B|nr:SDR family oxidoreductase [Bordetella bronchiseptica]KAK69808.1 KR domain protein [Bordetella bronchiseptica MO211]CCN16116.1 putative short chain dehydrogenase [Bordetella bronchiseptica MO211]